MTVTRTPAAYFRRLSPDAIVPTYGTSHSACFDFSACLPIDTSVTVYGANNVKSSIDVTTDRRLVLWPTLRYLIPTGWSVACPPDYSLRLYSRSGQALKQGLVLINGEGVIDEDYRHEVCVLLTNTSRVSVELHHGMRICQGEFVPKHTTNLVVCDVTDEEWFTTSRSGGFGSTGV